MISWRDTAEGCTVGAEKDYIHREIVEEQFSGSEKGVFWKRGLFRKVHFLEILENLENLEILEILEILENPQIVENKGETGHFLEILEILDILEILEIPPVKRPLS